jgi:ribosomal protein S18 acetylase RimI-like enzyme
MVELQETRFALPIEITPMREIDVHHLARIHFEALPNDFLPSLGLPFLERLYYPAVLNSAHAATFVVRTDQPVGFVTVAGDSPAFSREVLAGRRFALMGYALRRALGNPLHLVQSAQVLGAALRLGTDPIAAEIVFIAVDGPYRGQGIGQALVQAALGHLRRLAVTACRTKTLAENAGVISLYEKMGWHVRDRFRFLAKNYVNLAVKL